MGLLSGRDERAEMAAKLRGEQKKQLLELDKSGFLLAQKVPREGDAETAQGFRRLTGDWSWTRA